MPHQGGEKHRDRDNLGWKDSFGNQVCLVQQAGGGTLQRLVEKQPGQHSGKNEERVTVKAGRLHVQTDLKHEGPTEQQHQGMNQSPNPTYGGAHKALFEIAAHQLEEQTASLNQIPQKMSSRDSLGHVSIEQYQLYQ